MTEQKNQPSRVASYSHEKVAEGTRLLLEGLGENVDREGLHATPDRVARAWAEVTSGYDQEPGTVLLTSTGEVGFAEGGTDQMVVMAGIEFTSTCEHHLLPFVGLADVGYLPDPEKPIVVGASKLARLVEVFSRRLQVQERMTQQVANALAEHLHPIGVGVRVQGVHYCMVCRGVEKRASMVTEVLLGRFREHAIRDEFWHLADLGRKS
jgi:GTP cyclohydrolase I